MNHDLTVSKSIAINAPPAKVWEALTNPEIIKEYLFGTETITDWKEGNGIIFQGEYNDVKYRDKGVVQKNILHKLLSYRYWSAFSGLEDKPENYSLITYSIVDKGDTQTELTWAQQGFATQEGYEHSKGGINFLLENIKAIIERL